MSQWSAEQLHLLQHDARAAAASVLIPAGMRDQVEDVVQNTWIAADRVLDRFDPSRPFKPWICTVAKRQAMVLLRSSMAGRRLTNRVIHEASCGQRTVFDVIDQDVADVLLAEISEWEWLETILRIVHAVIETPEMFTRTIDLVTKFDGNVAAGAVGMGIQASTLRDSQRKVLDLARVVDRALRLREDRELDGRTDQKVSTGDLMRCLPDPDREDRAWLAAVTDHAASTVGGFGAVTVDSLCAATGWRHNSARQRLAHTRHLLLVALTVIEKGDFTIGAGGRGD